MPSYQIPLAKAEITDGDIQAVTDTLRSGIVSNGPRAAEFEQRFAEFTGARFAVSINSGTSALHLCMLAAGIGPGDEVITSAFSFIASANCIEMVGATPVFADIDPVTLNLDPQAVAARISPRTRAIIAVDIFGLAHDPRLDAIAAEHGIALIADSCEALGASVNGTEVGSCRSHQAACFGFYANKQLTTGEGGMITTNDEGFERLCRSLRNQGRGDRGGWLEHDHVGYNYRLDEMSAALGTSQLERLRETVERRACVARMYRERLEGCERLASLPEVPGHVRSWFVFPVLCEGGLSREEVISLLEAQGIQCGRYFSPPIHLQRCYREKYSYRPGLLPVTEGVSARILAVPFFAAMTPAQVERVSAALPAAVT